MKNNMVLKQFSYRLFHALPSLVIFAILQLVGGVCWVLFLDRGTPVELSLSYNYSIVSIACAIMVFVSIFNEKKEKLCNSIFNNGKIYFLTNSMLLFVVCLVVCFVNMLILPTVKVIEIIFANNITFENIGMFYPSIKAIVIEFFALLLFVFAIGELIIFLNKMLRKFFVVTLLIFSTAIFLIVSYSATIFESEFFVYVQNHLYALFLILLAMDIMFFIPSFLVVYLKEE